MFFSRFAVDFEIGNVGVCFYNTNPTPQTFPSLLPFTFPTLRTEKLDKYKKKILDIKD